MYQFGVGVYYLSNLHFRLIDVCHFFAERLMLSFSGIRDAVLSEKQVSLFGVSLISNTAQI
jgi:hypothetical protein